MAAGLGFKTFNSGDVLSAADVNGYLMQGVLVFASTAARDAAITAPAEGQFAFTKDTNSLFYYDGAAWVASGATGDIEGVTAGTGISGGGTSGTVTITNDMATTITAAGDIVVGTGSGTYDNLPIGTTAQVLTADTTVSPYKVKWATPASGSTFVGCVVRSTSGQTLTNNTLTAINWNSEDIDTDGFHDNATNNSRITIPTGKGGKYLISAKLAYQSSATGERAVQIYKNGSQISQMNIKNGLTGTFFTPSHTVVFAAVATDYFEVYGFQNSGGNLSTEPGGSGETQQFSITYLGA